jgi:hypothetical protein
VAFFKSLGDVIPCDECAEHYREFYATHDIKDCMGSKNTLLSYVNDLHNSVQKKIGRPPIKSYAKYFEPPDIQHQRSIFLHVWVGLLSLTVGVGFGNYMNKLITRAK